MTGIWAENAQTFILILAAATTLFFTIPLFFVPLKWAKFMLWRVPADTDLAIYFGRCLGAFALVLEFFMFRAGLYGTAITATFEFMLMFSVLMVPVHLWGWFKGIQPITETVEIGFWLIVVALLLAFWPAQ